MCDRLSVCVFVSVSGLVSAVPRVLVVSPCLQHPIGLCLRGHHHIGSRFGTIPLVQTTPFGQLRLGTSQVPRHHGLEA